MSTKEKVLELFKNNSDFISGEELARICDVSRAAIHKAITTLRTDGFDIEAVTNRGYKLKSFPDKISENEIKGILTTLGTEPGKIFAYNSIDSTNSECKRQASDVGSFRDGKNELTEGGKKLHRALFVAGEQTAGRGRIGRVFVSPPNSGVYFTLIYSPEKGISNPALLTAAAAVAESLAIDELYNANSQIKWVNDVFLGGNNGMKKISGILTEGISNFETGKIEAAIVGIGINVRNSGFSGELSKVAGDIESQVDCKSDCRVSRNQIVGHVIHHLLRFYDAFERSDKKIIGEMISEYKKRSILIGKEVTVNPVAGLQGESYKAKVIDISDEVELVVQTENFEKKYLHSGEVSLHSFDFV